MRYRTATLLCIILIFPVSCDLLQSEKVFRHGAVVCSDRLAAEVGLQVLREGGNAVDAACAVAFALAVTYPMAGNIGGGGFALIYQADSQEVFSIDFRETAPAAATADLYLDSAGGVDESRIRTGPSAAGIPGTVAGLYEMHRRFGLRSWADVVRPARQLADTGFVVGESLAASLAEHAEALGRFPATAAIFLPDGTTPVSGQRLIQSDLAVTLALIEQNGVDGFYQGEVADAIEAYCLTDGGIITAADLRQYRPVWRRPAHFTFRSLDVYAAGLPSSGGIVMGQILSMLNTYELERFTPDAPEYMHLFAEAARRAFADRSEYLGDPDFTTDVTDHLLDGAYIASRIKSIDPERASSSAQILPGMPEGPHESDQTTHLAVADDDGTIVSLTYTINAMFGCRAVVPGYGFLLNNEMDDFAVRPGVPNAFGLTGGEANRIEGGKRMLSSMTPTIVLKSGRPYLALGSPGGSRIISAVSQVLLNYHVFRMRLAEAVRAPRFHHQWLPDTLYVEKSAYAAAILQRLAAMGHHVSERTPFAEVMALAFSEDGMFITGAADPRRGSGTVAGF